ncbi:hypothetical protein [Labrenzia sp. DG1229]|uniref:hypothetical protein n=1 Tax=Labrenzia sp. DG1229 TaxID=681847 RepID=UPI000AA6DA91|nr:hypothetical protein [Labrenzia sp. DG1229]
MRAIANALRKRRTPKNFGEGLTALGEGVASGLYMQQANNAEKAGREGASDAFNSILSALGGGGSEAASVPSGSGVSYSGNIPADDLETDPVNRRISQGFSAFGGEGGSNYADAIASIESAGSGDYAAVGPQTGKGRAYGRYQVMDFNVGPWTEKHHGQRLSPEEFLASPEAQDAVFNGEFGSYVQKYGNPQDAASMWFTGKPAEQGANRADVNGMTGSRYVDKFTKALGTQTASLNPSIMPEEPAIDPKAVLAQRLTKMQGQGVSANPMAEEPQLAQAAPSQGVQRVAQAQQGMDQQTMQIIEAINNPYMQPGQKAVLGAMLKQRMQSNDPLHQMQLEKGQLELDRLKEPPLPDSVRALDERAVRAGLERGTEKYNEFMLSGGKSGVTVNVGGGPELGKLSTDYGYIRDPETREPVIDPETGLPTAAPVPGSLAAQKQQTANQKDEIKSGQAKVSTRVVSSAAMRAREAAGQRDFGPYGQSLVQHLPWTDSAEVSRQVEVLKSNAKIENLQAMRAASQTGGALGNVTEKESAMLADKAGALDASSPNFLRDLDDYELTLLQVIHGPEAGQQIFNSSRQAEPELSVDDLLQKYGGQ